MSLAMRDIKNPRNYINNYETLHNYEDLITVEHRSNNTKRDYLFVNKLQCKHIPCSPSAMMYMCSALAAKVNTELDSKPIESALVVGFAETATAIGQFVGRMIHKAKYITCTTRERVGGSEEIIRFEEEHSHATLQKLLTYSTSPINIDNYDYILFVEDEISTGNTILNFINAFESQHNTSSDGTKQREIRYGVASICNWQSESNKAKFREYNIDTFYLLSGTLKDVNIKMGIEIDDMEKQIGTPIYDAMCTLEDRALDASTLYKIVNTRAFSKGRLGHDRDNVIKTDLALRRIRDYIYYEEKPIRNIRVIGTEEFMEVPIRIGASLEQIDNYNVVCHATTRSKIDVLRSTFDGVKDGIKTRMELRSFYDNNRITYLYNFNEHVDLTIVVTDTPDRDILISAFTELYYKMREYSDRFIVISL